MSMFSSVRRHHVKSPDASSSYWECSYPTSATLFTHRDGTESSSLSSLSVLAQGKEIAAVLKDSNNFTSLNAVNANMLAFMHSRTTLEEKSSSAFYCTARKTE